MMALRPYQQQALDAVRTALLEKGITRQLMKKPTGTGKTVTFAALPTALADWLQQFPAKERRMLVIAHREELLDQAAAKIRAANPDLVVMIEQGDRRASLYSDVVVASVQTLAAVGYRRLNRLMRHMRFRVVVVDEAHHAAASTYRTVLARLGFLPPAVSSDDDNIEAATFDDVKVMNAALREWDAKAPKDRVLLGVTATPNRSDAVGLGCVFQQIVFSYDLRAAIEDGWLVPLKPYAIETDTSLEGVRTTAGDFNQKDLAEAVNNALRNQLAVAAWKEKAQGRPTIAFTVDVAHAHSLAEAFRQAGIAAAAVSGETPKDERRQLLADFAAGRITVLCNCMVLTEGTDLPITGCILHAKPTKSATLYEQMTGRGLRLYDGKTECVVIDLVDVSRRHSLQTAPVLHGLPPSLVVDGDDLGAVEAEIERLREEYPNFDIEAALAAGRLTLAELRARAVAVDVWKLEPLDAEFAAGRELSWIRMGDRYRISYSWTPPGNREEVYESIVVTRNLLGTWDALLTSRVKDGQGWHHVHEITLASGVVDAASAAGVAEGFIESRRPQAFKMKLTTASWRTKPATPGQLKFLAKLRVPVAPGLLAGEASDLIDRNKGRRPK